MKKLSLFLMIGFLFLGAILFVYSNRFSLASFHIARWKEPKGCERLRMLSDLNKNYLRLGMSKKEVESLLGNHFSFSSYFHQDQSYPVCSKTFQTDGLDAMVTIEYEQGRLVETYYCEDDFCDSKRVFIENPHDPILNPLEKVLRRLTF